MKIQFIICLLVIFNNSLISQEICNNAIDDDNDGLIDLNDDDCNCNELLSFSMLPNASFEDKECCPDYFSQLDCVKNWFIGSQQTPDYFNTCGFLSYLDIDEPVLSRRPSIPPLPLPNGTGFTGFFVVGTSSGTYKEYLGICTKETLQKNTMYQLNFYLGFGIKDENTVTSLSPIEINIYGNPNCNPIPLDESNCSGDLNNNWLLLKSVVVEGFEEWKLVEAKFKIPENVNHILIGPGCQEIDVGQSHYYFLDRLILAKESNKLPFSEIKVVNGYSCQGNLELEVPLLKDATYQWFKDGIAIVGANKFIYQILVQDEGDFQVTITTPISCIITDKFQYTIDGFPIANLGQDTFLCEDSTLILGRENVGELFQWNTGETSKTITVNESGLYAVTVTNECGESIDEIEVLPIEIFSCNLKIPNVFTPNNDGINDSFGLITDCCLLDYKIQIFNRWGSLVFESESIENRWVGGQEKNIFPTGVYVWSIIYSAKNNQGVKEIKKLKGDVTLIR